MARKTKSDSKSALPKEPPVKVSRAKSALEKDVASKKPRTKTPRAAKAVAPSPELPLNSAPVLAPAKRTPKKADPAPLKTDTKPIGRPALAKALERRDGAPQPSPPSAKPARYGLIDLTPGAQDARVPRYASPAPKHTAVFAKSVGSFVPKLTRAAFEKNGFSTVTLLSDWAEIVGAGLARAATPERLVWPRAGTRRAPSAKGGQTRVAAILVLSVDPSRALEVEYRASQIVERINGYFGYRAVERLRIEQAPFLASEPAAPVWKPPRRAPEPFAPPPEIEGIADAALRDALARLAASVLNGAYRP